MEPILSFREKIFWTQQNNRANIWMSSINSKGNDDKIKVLFNFEPFFVFHRSVSLPLAVAEVMDLNNDLDNLVSINECIAAGDVLLQKEGLIKRYKFDIPQWGTMRVCIATL